MRSPELSVDSSTALILVHDEDNDDQALPIPDLNDDDDNESFQLPAPSVPQLSRFAIFLYLLSPLLKLGVILLPNTEFSLKYGLPSLLFFAVLSAFSRQIWHNLALYVRNPDMEYVVLDALARGRNKAPLRAILRSLIRIGTTSLRVLLAALYLRDAAHTLAPLCPTKIHLPKEPALIILFTIVLFPISLGQSLASKRILYSTLCSILCFVGWLACVSTSYARGNLQTSPAWLRVGLLWQGMTVTAFAFTSSSTLTLYASSEGAMQALINPRKYHRHSFRLLSILSVVVATCFMVPLVVFSAFPKRPQPLSGFRDLLAFMYILHAFTLLLSIPFLIVTSPRLQIPDHLRISTRLPLSRIFLSTLVALLALVPHGVAVVLSDILMLIALGSTYFFPALIHVIMHQIKRPLSIVLPQTTYSPLSSPRPLADEDDPPVTDELLLRKERSLQRHQLRRRIIWDVGVWVLLIPVGGGGLAWMIGKIVGKW